jgi:hypothetical protein
VVRTPGRANVAGVILALYGQLYGLGRTEKPARSSFQRGYVTMHAGGGTRTRNPVRKPLERRLRLPVSPRPQGRLGDAGAIRNPPAVRLLQAVHSLS